MRRGKVPRRDRPGKTIADVAVLFNVSENLIQRPLGSRTLDMLKRIVPPSKEVMRQLIEFADERFRVKLIFAVSTGSAGERVSCATLASYRVRPPRSPHRSPSR